MKHFPKARKDHVIIREFGDEVLLYDRSRDKALCLNRTAALVWKHCDGRTSIEQITNRLGKEISREFETPIDERLVWYAIRQLKREHLLEDPVEIRRGVPASMKGHLNRRQVIRTLGLTTIVALPLVSSIIAPKAAQAATCLPGGAACSSSLQCCSGICNLGLCL
ncbi:MAG TPA: PqqD family peptide modification chaperone [Pyrinomonadaceae bacterium]|nr:PqqD family peptide modification chaperone [Pyrinomonadaceae bacterium]